MSDIPEFNLTDIGNARRMIYHFGDQVLYCGAWDQWLVWHQSRWQVDETGAIYRIAKQIPLDRIHQEAAQQPARAGKLRTWARKSESAGKIDAMIRMARSEREIVATPDSFDADPWLINAKNAIVDLRTGKTIEHDPSHRVMKQVNAVYDPKAKCPMWLAFLGKIMGGNQNLITFLQRAVGYSLTGITREQVVFFLHGTGANGKSTFLNALRYVLGDYGRNTPTGTLMRKRDGGNGASDDLARLLGVRFITAIETDENQMLSESTIKSLTGDDVITARHLYSGYFDFKPAGKIWLACNHKPTITGVDNGIWRRIRLIPFDVTITDTERDDDLPRKLETEAAGILAWAIQGCLDWQAHRLGLPDEVKAAVNEYRSEMDMIAAFIEDECVITPNAATATSDIYQRYQAWCSAGGERALNQIALGRKLAERGFKSHKGANGRKVWAGIGLKANG